MNNCIIINQINIKLFISVSLSRPGIGCLKKCQPISGRDIFLTAVARSGFIPKHYPVLITGAKAKTVTNNLPLLSVLPVGIFCHVRIVFYLVVGSIKSQRLP
jgi:hypothetical protein